MCSRHFGLWPLYSRINSPSRLSLDHIEPDLEGQAVILSIRSLYSGNHQALQPTPNFSSLSAGLVSSQCLPYVANGSLGLSDYRGVVSLALAVAARRPR